MSTCLPRMAAGLAIAMALAGLANAATYEGFTEPIHSIEVSAADTGRVAEVHVQRGDSVRRGDLLMTLDTQILEASRRLAVARTKAAARIEALKVEYDLEQSRYEQLLGLRAEGAGSREEVQRAKANAEVARLNVQAAEEERELSELQLAEIEARLEQRRIRSPVDGIVTDLLKETGEYVSVTQPHVATVVQLGALRVTFYVPTRVAMSFALAQEVALDFPESGHHTRGKMEHIGAVTAADSGRVRIDVLIQNDDSTYRSGVRCVMQVAGGKEQDN